MIKTIIVDDERLARNELRKILKEFPEIEVIEEAVNAEDAQEKIELLQPELIFLDIQMPGGKTGFDLLEQLEYTPKVLFTTAYSEFAIKAFEYIHRHTELIRFGHHALTGGPEFGNGVAQGGEHLNGKVRGRVVFVCVK